MKDISEIKKTWFNHLNGWGSETFFIPFINPISKLLSTSNCEGKVLDIGCGFGEKSFVFQKLGFNVVAFDADSERINKAKITYPTIDFSNFKFDKQLPFDCNSFDVIFSHSFMQYVNHNKLLDESNRVLKKSGKIIFIENLKNNPFTKIGRFYRKLSKFNYQSYPWNHISKNQIPSLFNNFKNVNIQFAHLLSPLCEIDSFKKHYPFLHKLDNKLLKFKFLNNIAWLCMITAEK